MSSVPMVVCVSNRVKGAGVENLKFPLPSQVERLTELVKVAQSPSPAIIPHQTNAHHASYIQSLNNP